MTCVHHWVLPSPDGTPTLTATCRHCGAERAMAASHAGLVFFVERRNKQNRAAEASRKARQRKGAKT